MLYAITLVLAALGAKAAPLVDPTIAATDPSTHPELKATRVLIASWDEDGVKASMYGYGGLVDSPLTLDNGTTITVQNWANGTSVEIEGAVVFDDDEDDGEGLGKRMVSLEKGALEARVCKRSCKRTINVWANTVKEGTWYPAFKSTDRVAFDYGHISFCDSIITLPTFSGSIGLSIGVLSGALGIAPEGASSKGRCYGCNAQSGCWKLWTQTKMHWKDAHVYRRDVQEDNGMNACSICNREWDRTEDLGIVRADYAETSDGLPIIIPQCRKC
ncbi:hypothetical protein OQA88_6979 [Cercophora sp. LCS_1]